MKVYIVFAAIILCACSSNRRVSHATTKKIFRDSTARVYSLDPQPGKDLVYYITPTGKKILLQKADSSLLQEENEIADSERAAITLEDSIRVSANIASTVADLAHRAGPNDPFTGSIRITPKNSYSAKRNEIFPGIPALYRNLKSKEFMNNLGIGNLDRRHELENRNVRITKAYLYTITLETDNDLHLLIGNTPSYVPGVTRVFNAEISAIPPDGSADLKEHMREVRRKVLGELGDVPLCGNKNYLQSNTRITISGSLFYDTHHATKPAKCREVEGESAWELHPVWDITIAR